MAQICCTLAALLPGFCLRLQFMGALYVHLQGQPTTAGLQDLGMLESRLLKVKNTTCFAIGAILTEIHDMRLYRERGFNPIP